MTQSRTNGSPSQVSGGSTFGVSAPAASAGFAAVSVAKVTFWAYAFTGVLCGIAAIIFTSRVATAKADAGEGFELDVITAVKDFAEQWKNQPCLGFTHFQPAQPTTVGKRASLWIQDLLLDLEDLDHLMRTTPVRGVKGTTGTQASFLELFEGDGAQVEALEQRFCQKVGFPAIPVSGQTASRKLEDRYGQVLCGIAASASKFACDLRLLQHLKEVEEPFETQQIGSSAMPYKRNPMRSERINSLARFVLGLMPSTYQTSASQWMERTLDDSAHRRLTISQGLLATDAILVLLRNVASGLVVYPRMIEARLSQELPFMAAEVLLMEAVKRGGDRQDLHERFRVAALEAGRRIKQEGRPNELLALLAADPAWAMTETELAALLDPVRFTGRAGAQVTRFLAGEVAAALAGHAPGAQAAVRV